MGFFVCRARYERRDRERAGKRAAGSNTGKESKPTTDEKKKTERQGAAAERERARARGRREREREREAEEESAQWGPSGQWGVGVASCFWPLFLAVAVVMW